MQQSERKNRWSTGTASVDKNCGSHAINGLSRSRLTYHALIHGTVINIYVHHPFPSQRTLVDANGVVDPYDPDKPSPKGEVQNKIPTNPFTFGRFPGDTLYGCTPIQDLSLFEFEIKPLFKLSRNISSLYAQHSRPRSVLVAVTNELNNVLLLKSEISTEATSAFEVELTSTQPPSSKIGKHVLFVRTGICRSSGYPAKALRWYIATPSALQPSVPIRARYPRRNVLNLRRAPALHLQWHFHEQKRYILKGLPIAHGQYLHKPAEQTSGGKFGAGKVGREAVCCTGRRPKKAFSEPFSADRFEVRLKQCCFIANLFFKKYYEYSTAL